MNAALRWITVAVAALAVFAIAGSFVVRTYEIRDVFDSAHAAWTDEQLVLFIRNVQSGSSQTIVERAAQWRSPLSFLPMRPRWLYRDVATIVRYQSGAATQTVEPVPWNRSVYVPFIAEKKLHVMGGVWTGTRIAELPTREYWKNYDIRDADMAGWQVSTLMSEGAGTIALPLRVNGEAMTLRGEADVHRAVIELVRADGTVVPLWSLSMRTRTVSERAFDATFDVKPAP